MGVQVDLRDVVLRSLRGLDLSVTGIRRWFSPHVQGIEVTQSIQYRDAERHLTDPADRQPDNAVTLVAGKPAWARVYVRAGLLGGATSGVTGTLEVFRRYGGFLYGSLGTLSPQAPGTVTAEQDPDYATERGSLASTLNFVIPADLMCGHLRLVATITTPGGATDTETIHVNVTLRQTLRLRGILIGYNGPSSTAMGAPNLTIAAPTLAQLQATSAWALTAFPVESTGTYSSAGTMTWNRPLSDAPSCAGCCTPNWVALNAQVAAQVTADGNRTDVIYYGLLATGIPMGPVIGCESSGVSAGGVNDGVTLAHEIGHHCGMPHAPCGGVGTPDPTFPAYEPYDPAGTPRASIGEYALNINTGAIMSPASFKDLMSYCGPRWISLHNHGRLLNHTLLDPRLTCVDHPWWRDYILYDPLLIPERWLPDPPPDPWIRVIDPEPLISIIGVLHSERELEVTSVMRLDTRRAPQRGARTAMVAELVGQGGERLASAPLHELRSHAMGCGCGGEGAHDEGRYPCVVQALLPAADKGAALVIRRGEVDLWTRRAPAREPRVRSFEAELGKEALELRWEAEVEAEPEVWAQWSADGETWHALAVGLADGRAALAPALLPPGKAALRILAGDGFLTAASEVAWVEVPERDPDVTILSPRDGQTVVAGEPLRLWGGVLHAGEEHERERRIDARWILDGAGVAEGLDAFVTAPEPGEHRLELQVATRGFDARATATFVTVARER